MTPAPTFDVTRLDALMRAAQLDVLVVTSKHNTRYLLDGHHCRFFDHMDAVGIGRYLPALVYVRDHPELAHYVGWAGEAWDTDIAPLWVPSIRTDAFHGADAATSVAEYLTGIGLVDARIGLELAFLPVDAYQILRDRLPAAYLDEAHLVLETLRATKRPAEVDKVDTCSVRVVESMLATFDVTRPGWTKADMVERLRHEETVRGLTFEYCLISMGRDLNRSPSAQPLEVGDVVSMDSGGQFDGYVGDVARMGVCGEPDDELLELLAAVDEIQLATRDAIWPGSPGGDIFAAAEAAILKQGFRLPVRFVAHGMGLISHEAPRLTATGPIRYPATHAASPLESGMVLSVETWIESPTRGFIKLEDTLIVTEDGHRAVGDTARGWNRIPST